MRRFWGRVNERRGRVGESGGRTNKKRSRERRVMTWDPSAPMGRRELRWWGRGGRDSAVSPPVGHGVGGICDRGIQETPFAPPPTTKVGTEVGEDGASVFGGGAVARAAAVERRGLRRRGAPAVPVGRAHPLFLTR